MKVSFIKLCKTRIPKSLLIRQINFISSYLKKKKVADLKGLELNLVFVSSKKIRSLNAQYRKKDKVTDVLSFQGENELLGELIFCPSFIKKQSEQQKHTCTNLLTYYLIHGILHLLGFDHGKNTVKTRKMFQLQDDIFDKITK